MMFSLDLCVGGLFLACTSSQSYYVLVKEGEKKNLFKRWFPGRRAGVANTYGQEGLEGYPFIGTSIYKCLVRSGPFRHF